MTFNKESIDRLTQQYQAAVEQNLEGFEFTDDNGISVPLVTTYAKYLIQYLEQLLEQKSPVPSITKEQIQKIEDTFAQRCINNDVHKHNATYYKMQVEFFSGALSALNTLGFELVASWTIHIMSHRPIISIEKIAK